MFHVTPMFHGSIGSYFFVVCKKVGVLLCMRTSTNLHCCDAALKINETLNAYFVTSLSHNFRWEICETSNQLGTLYVISMPCEHKQFVGQALTPSILFISFSSIFCDNVHEMEQTMYMYWMTKTFYLLSVGWSHFSLGSLLVKHSAGSKQWFQ